MRSISCSLTPWTYEVVFTVKSRTGKVGESLLLVINLLVIDIYTSNIDTILFFFRDHLVPSLTKQGKGTVYILELNLIQYKY